MIGRNNLSLVEQVKHSESVFHQLKSYVYRDNTIPLSPDIFIDLLNNGARNLQLISSRLIMGEIEYKYKAFYKNSPIITVTENKIYDT